MQSSDGFTAEERSQLRAVIVDHRRIMLTVFGDGNGHKGLLSQINDHLTRDDEREKARAKLDRRRSRVHFALLGALLALVTGCSVVVFQMWVQGHRVVSIDAPTVRSEAHPQDAAASSTHY